MELDTVTSEEVVRATGEPSHGMANPQKEATNHQGNITMCGPVRKDMIYAADLAVTLSSLGFYYGLIRAVGDA